jgi:hypothetical protein
MKGGGRQRCRQPGAGTSHDASQTYNRRVPYDEGDRSTHFTLTRALSEGEYFFNVQRPAALLRGPFLAHEIMGDSRR